MSEKIGILLEKAWGDEPSKRPFAPFLQPEYSLMGHGPITLR